MSYPQHLLISNYPSTPFDTSVQPVFRFTMAPRPFISTVRNHNSRSRRNRLQEFPPHYEEEVFAPMRRLQEQSPDLLLFDRSKCGLATFGYPLSATTQEPISPHGIMDYAERRRIYYECNCGLVSEHPCILELFMTRRGVIGKCGTCGTYVDFSRIYNTFTKGSPYEGHNRRAAMQPATAPAIIIPRHDLDFPRGYYHYRRTTRSAMTGRRSFRQVTPFQARSHIPSDSTFSPPSPSELLRGSKSKGKTAAHPPSRFMSLASPSSSQASNLMGLDNAAAGSSSNSSGPDSPLQFCDICYAAYPVQDFPNHVCTAN